MRFCISADCCNVALVGGEKKGTEIVVLKVEQIISSDDEFGIKIQRLIYEKLQKILVLLLGEMK